MRGTEQRRRTEDLDVQYALSEYYFSEEEEEESEEDSGKDDDDVDGAVPGPMETVIMDLDDAEDLLAEYYGYSSGSDVSIQALFLDDDDDDDDDDDGDKDDGDSSSDHGGDASDLLDDGTDDDGYNVRGLSSRFFSNSSSSFGKALGAEPRSSEESLAEQLAKITPQILAAISVATKTLSASQEKKVSSAMARASAMMAGALPPGLTRPSHHHSACSAACGVASDHPAPASTEGYAMMMMAGGSGAVSLPRDTGLRLDEVMDTKKLSKILSTSPPSSSHPTRAAADIVPPRRVLPMDAFRRSRRNSIQLMQQSSLVHALRQNSTNCMLTGAPEEQLSTSTATMYFTQPRRQTMPANGQQDQLAVQVEFECETEADDESSSAWTECEWTAEDGGGILEMSPAWWSFASSSSTLL